MPHIVTTNFKYTTALSFIGSMVPSKNSLYLFIGRQLPWANSEITPPIPVPSNFFYKDIWDNMIAAKLVTPNDMSLVIPKVTWSSNTVYTAYSDRVDMFNLANTSNSFYIITACNEVYKCISNSNGALSTQQPVGLGSSSSNYIQTLSDGYQWKYMLNVENIDIFLTNSWVPVPTIPPPNSFQDLMANSAIPGSICAINVITQGSNYTNNSISYIINITGDGIGANAYANVSNGQFKNIVMTNFGQDYTYARVTVVPQSGGHGSGATAQAVISPFGGHGSNASLELGAKAVMIAIETANSENGYFTTTNTFRQNGLILNPLLYGTSNIASNTIVQTATYISVGGGSGVYNNGEQVFQGTDINSSTFSGTVIDYGSTPNLLRLNNILGSPQISSILAGVSSGTQRYITSIRTPDLQPYTGSIIDYDNSTFIQRQPGQTELFQFVEVFGD